LHWGKIIFWQFDLSNEAYDTLCGTYDTCIVRVTPIMPCDAMHPTHIQHIQHYM
jgi:hypothetical protein